jgi:hypothetical protein
MLNTINLILSYTLCGYVHSNYDVFLLSLIVLLQEIRLFEASFHYKCVKVEKCVKETRIRTSVNNCVSQWNAATIAKINE